MALNEHGREHLRVLYRGPLASCNYACPYCPFAKRIDPPEALRGDRLALARFLDWCERREYAPLSVLFTPWGEGLVRWWYQDALARLSRLPHVRKVAIQTNLSGKLDFLSECDVRKVGLWCTYHPGEVDRTRFLAQCVRLLTAGVSFSVGVVGLREHLAEIEALRAELPDRVYVWVNAYKREPDYYDADALAFLERIDPLFPLNNTRHASLGEACAAGHTAISVDGDGVARRCHFVAQPIGNIYDDAFDTALVARPCPNATCGCHIGYVYLERLGLERVFGDSLPERVPGKIADTAGC